MSVKRSVAWLHDIVAVGYVSQPQDVRRGHHPLIVYRRKLSVVGRDFIGDLTARREDRFGLEVWPSMIANAD